MLSSTLNTTYQQKGQKLYEEQRNSYSNGTTFLNLNPLIQDHI